MPVRLLSVPYDSARLRVGAGAGPQALIEHHGLPDALRSAGFAVAVEEVLIEEGLDRRSRGASRSSAGSPRGSPPRWLTDFDGRIGRAAVRLGVAIADAARRRADA